jgi:peroxiredoxin
MDRPAAIRAGLLQGFDSFSVTTFDGSVLLRYRENDGKPEGTVIGSPDKGSYTWIFDPFFLATLQKEQAKWGQNRLALAEADRLFARVVNEFSLTGPIGTELARRARPELDELRHLQIGQPAPETSGEDLEGRPIRLGDYRGQVVVLAFWCCGYSEASEHRKLIEQMAGKPFALIGINGDNQIGRARSAVSEQEVTWPCLFERGVGPVHTRWNVRKWLTTIVLDRNGVIRHRDLRGRELAEAVEALLRD